MQELFRLSWSTEKKPKSLRYVTPQMLYQDFAEKYILGIYLYSNGKLESVCILVSNEAMAL